METALAIQTECAILRYGGVRLNGFGASDPERQELQFQSAIEELLPGFKR